MAERQRPRQGGDPVAPANTPSGLPGALTDGECIGFDCVVHDDNGIVCRSGHSGKSCWYDPTFDRGRPENGGTGINKGGSTGSGAGGKPCTSGYTMTNGIVQCGSGAGGQKN